VESILTRGIKADPRYQNIQIVGEDIDNQPLPEKQQKPVCYFYP